MFRKTIFFMNKQVISVFFIILITSNSFMYSMQKSLKSIARGTLATLAGTFIYNKVFLPNRDANKIFITDDIIRHAYHLFRNTPLLSKLIAAQMEMQRNAVIKKQKMWQDQLLMNEEMGYYPYEIPTKEQFKVINKALEDMGVEHPIIVRKKNLPVDSTFEADKGLITINSNVNDEPLMDFFYFLTKLEALILASYAAHFDGSFASDRPNSCFYDANSENLEAKPITYTETEAFQTIGEKVYDDMLMNFVYNSPKSKTLTLVSNTKHNGDSLFTNIPEQFEIQSDACTEAFLKIDCDFCCKLAAATLMNFEEYCPLTTSEIRSLIKTRIPSGHTCDKCQSWKYYIGALFVIASQFYQTWNFISK